MRLLPALLIATLTAGLLPACTSAPKYPDITVKAMANPKSDLTGYTTYAWGAAAAMIRDPDREWTAPDMNIGAEIRHLVNRELRAKGVTEVAADPEMLAIYAVGVDMKTLDVVMDEGDVEQFKQVQRGEVLLVLLDPETRRAIWGGSAVAELLKEPDLELGKKRLDYAITEMFKNYPK